MRAPNNTPNPNLRERGQALVEYALITVLIGITFGAGLAATGPAVGGLFDRIVDDVLRQTEIVDAPGSVGFWNTVTSVYEFVPTGGGLATNTPLVPTAVDTAGGPTPVFTNTFTPSPIPSTPTPTLTKTPGDIQKNAPFKDTVDEPDWWRIDSNVNLRGTPWTGDFFNSVDLSGAVASSVPGIMVIDRAGSFISNFPAGSPGQNFSARFTRTIEVIDDLSTVPVESLALTFRILADDGVRVFVNGTPITLRDANNNTASWVDQTNPILWTGVNVSAPGIHTIIVEYYNKTGTGRLKVDVVGGGANPDDRANTAGNPFSCNWGTYTNSNDSNTESNMFDDYVGGPSSANTTCYLEWRGTVIVPTTLVRPELAFWDVWDLPVGAEAWVEVAEYIPLDAAAFPQSANRSAMSWQRINLSHTTGGTANYNWTRNAIDLTPLMVSFTSTPKRLAFRFVIRTTGVVSLTKWHVDDIEVRDATSTLIAVNRLWNLDNADERFEFIVDGGRSNPGDESGWRLVTNNRFGTSGLAWHDSSDPLVDDPNNVGGAGPSGVNGYTPYKRHSESPVSDLLNNVRVHSLEFNGFIDLANVPNPDSQSNTGVPTLSFYHGFHVGGKTGLEVQYTTDGYSVSPANWQTLPGGVIRSITTAGELRSPTLQQLNVPLNGLPGNPPQIRLRFAMLVHAQAEVKDGWWIDQIRLGRAESPKWLNYPFFDDAQGSGQQLFWSYSGLWEPTTTIAYTGVNPSATAPISYASSPRGFYVNGQSTYLTMSWPIDLYNDTPAKRVIQDANGAIITSNSQPTPAINPEITFVHWREIAATDAFRIEWKRVDEPVGSWRVFWMYRHSMATNPASASARTANNQTWEFTRVSLYPILKQIATDGGGLPGVGTGAALRDDDIMIRFGLIADGSTNDDGVFIDDIRVNDNSGQVLKLWPPNENRVDPFNSVSLGVGTGAFFDAEPDFVSSNQEWWEVFRTSGTWNAVSFDARGGALSLHDSPIGGQDRAPSGYRNINTNADDFGDAAWRTPDDNFTVMEFEPIIDLRAVRGEAEAPMLTFWTRYHIGQNDFVRVEISTEDTRAAATIDGSMSARCAGQAVLQCYHQERGWLPWTTAWTRGNTNGSEASYGWQKVMVNLTPYAYLANSNTQGKRIRVRFVYDALDSSTNFDGWYIDGIRFEYRLTGVLSTNINLAEFYDASLNLTNWTAEGKWGLDVAVFQGGGGGPVTLGAWDVKWWECRTLCESLAPNGTSNSNRFREGTKVFLQNPTPAAGERQQLVTNINYRFFSGSPVSGWSKTDYLVMRAVIDTPVVGGSGFPSGVRSFTSRADDGVRLKIEELVAGVPVTPTPLEWNIINRWTDSAEVADQGTFSFVSGKRYRITFDYYEKTGDGAVTLTVTDGRFSFSDSPKASGGPVPDIRPIPYANTSLILKRVLNLTEVPANSIVLLEYQTKYRLHSNSNARLEVSSDGGFTWVNTNLTQAPPPAFAAYNLSFSSTSFSDATYGVTTPGSEPWQPRLNNLTAYKGQNVIIRFRLDRQTTSCVKREDCDGSDSVGNPSLHLVDTYYDGWWITPVRVLKFEP